MTSGYRFTQTSHIILHRPIVCSGPIDANPVFQEVVILQTDDSAGDSKSLQLLALIPASNTVTVVLFPGPWTSSLQSPYQT